MEWLPNKTLQAYATFGEIKIECLFIGQKATNIERRTPSDQIQY
jgi:hypothetical protein